VKLPHLGVGVLDQLLSSASNALIVFAIARVSTVDSFGTISLALAALSSTLLISRGVFGAPIALLSNRPTDLGFEVSHAFGAAGVLGSAVSFLIIPLSLPAGGYAMAVVLGLAVPIVLIQDVGRFYVTAASRPGVAALSDGLWAASALLLLLTTFLPEPPLGSLGLIVGWTVSAFVSAVLVIALGGAYPRLHGIRRWFAASRYHRSTFGLDAVVGALGSFVLIWLVGFWLGPPAIAAVRGAGTVLGPIAALVSAIQFAVIPELRRRGLPVQALWSALVRIALPMSVVSLGIAAVSLLIPASWGHILLGDSWTLVRTVLPIMGAEYAAISWYAAVAAGLTVRAKSGSLLALRTTHVALSAVAVVLGAGVFMSVRVVATGFVAAVVFATLGGRRALLSGTRREQPDPDRSDPTEGRR